MYKCFGMRCYSRHKMAAENGITWPINRSIQARWSDHLNGISWPKGQVSGNTWPKVQIPSMDLIGESAPTLIRALRTKRPLLFEGSFW